MPPKRARQQPRTIILKKDIVMASFSIEDFRGKVNSMYELVLVAAKRANQLARPDTRPFIETDSRKPTTIALEEILAGKIKCVNHLDDEDEFLA